MPIANDVILGEGARVIQPDLVNLYGCTIGDDTRIGPFVEIQAGASIGARCKISSHSFICGGVSIADEVFIGHGVVFTNDVHPRATTAFGVPQGSGDWEICPTFVDFRASIGSNATLLPNVRIGEGAVVGAGSVVTKDVAPFTIVAGVPARLVKRAKEMP